MQPIDEKAVFNVARQIDARAARSEYLRQVYGADSAALGRVEQLLHVHEQQQSFLESPAVAIQATIAQPPTENAGTQIGPFKLIEQIGEGGMGTVWMAQQSEPVKRLVALKLIKAGMDSRQVIARFEAERQALALMDHPNIARVIDGGTTSAGRPYFVMDLVRGVPITQYCDEHHLTPRQRLELLLPVCQAVQHAHQKGIIHRDLKPSNVLVALYDGRPVPKVIDFGVAKAAGQPLTEQTLVTGFGNIVGTLEYMSPEQAQVNQLDIDTRSDIYSLGVLLYELLTGSPPFSRKELEKAGMLEMLRIIREQEPSKPSTKLSTAEGLPTLAANRGTEPAKLTKLVRGELDWIVMKALEKDRSRRYETAAGFAADLQRYLSDEPVQACPPSIGYKLRKFARRYKRVVVTASAFVLLLVLGVVASTWQAVRATRAQVQARAAEEQAKVEAAINLAVTTFVQEDLLGPADIEGQPEPGLSPDRDVKVRTLLDRAAATVQERFAKQPLVEAAIRLTIGNAYRSLGETTKAKVQLERAVEIRSRVLGAEHEDTLAARNSLSHANLKTGDLQRQKKVEPQLREILEISERVLGSEHPITLTARHLLALWHSEQQKYAQCELLNVQTLEARRRVLGPDHLETLRTQHNLALVYLQQRKMDKAEPLLVQTLKVCRRTLGAEHPLTLSSMNSLGSAYRMQRQYAQAEAQLLEALEVSRRVLGPESTTRYLLKNLADVYLKQQQFAKAEPLIVESVHIALQQTEESRGPNAWIQLADLYAAQHRLLLVEQKKYAEAEPILRQLLDIYIVAKPWLKFQTRSLLGACWTSQQKYEPAERLLLSGYEGLRASEGAIPIADRKLLAEALERIVQLYQAWGKPEQAAQWQTKLDHEKEQQPRRADALVEFSRGQTLAKEHKYDEAKVAFGEAIRLEPAYPEAHYHLGMALAQQRRPAQAEGSFAEAARLMPEYAQAQYCLGWALQAQGKAVEAEVAYQAARKGNGLSQASFEAVRAGLGWALEKQKKWDEAAEVYRQIIKFKPKIADAYRGLGTALRAQGKLDDAVAEFRKAIEVDSKYATAYGYLASALEAQGKLDEAALNYRKASELNPKNSEPLVGLGTLLLSQKKNDEAIVAFRQAIEVDPKNAVAYTHLTSALRAQGKSDEIVALFRQASEVNPQDPRHLIGLGTALRGQKKLDEAITAFRKAIEVDPKFVAAYMNLGSILHEQRKPDEAATTYRKVIELSPNFHFAYEGLGRALTAQGKLDEAIAAYRQAIELNPKSAGAHQDLGILFCDRKHDYDSAVAAFRQAIAIQPQWAEAHFNLGLARRHKGDWQEAITAFQEAIRLQPTFARAHTNLAHCLTICSDLALRNPREALEAAQKGAELTPQSHLAWLALGWANYRAQDWKASIAALEKSMALQMAPKGGDSKQWFFLAMAHWQLGEKEKARVWYDRAVEWTGKYQPQNEELGRIRAEAQELINQSEP